MFVNNSNNADQVYRIYNTPTGFRSAPCIAGRAPGRPRNDSYSISCSNNSYSMIAILLIVVMIAILLIVVIIAIL